RRTRGELFFARVWILVEGETDVIVLSGAARALGIELEQAAVRIVDYAQSDLSIFIAAADSLGILWHVFSDGDAAGAKNLKKARDALAGRPEKAHLTLLPNGEPIEPFLCRNGFVEIYEEHASPQNRPRYITVDKDNDAYPSQLYQCLPNNGKPSAAHAVVASMITRGRDSVPTEIAECLGTAMKLAEGR
ncbi:TOPRIM nucleotidyl transferase/hydrolase domain-containing protein, partial [Burkholderia pseudomallei]|uniref:ATP-dependent nuclease n=1 Tax=Burkholderia pseudomallei TaxID=28450 RepID=UPI00344FBBE6